MSVSSQLANLVANTSIAITICLLALSGCSGSDSTTRPATASRPVKRDHLPDWELPVVSGTELRGVVQQSDRPVLVEFGVNFGCARCDDMQPQMERLASDFDGRARVIRVDFNANRQLVAQYGGNICPTYVLFKHGKPVVTRSYPTSADLLAADLDAAAARDQD
jgi:thioredoxin 1